LKTYHTISQLIDRFVTRRSQHIEVGLHIAKSHDAIQHIGLYIAAGVDVWLWTEA